MTPTITTVSESFEGKTISCAQIVCSDPCSYKFSKIVSADDDYQFQGVFKSTANKTLTIQVGDSVQTLDITSTFTRYVLSFHNVTIVDNDSVYVTFPAGTYYLYNLQLERGTVATQWQPAPEDAIDVVPVSAEAQTTIFNLLTQNGTAQGIFLQDGKLYINGEYIQANTINADKIHGGTLSGAAINIGNGVFEVDDAGLVNASNINITGGTIRIDTTGGSAVNNIIFRHEWAGVEHGVFISGDYILYTNGDNHIQILGDEIYVAKGTGANVKTVAHLENISGNGRFSVYDSNGVKRAQMGAGSVTVFAADGIERSVLSPTGLQFYKSDNSFGNTFPATGNPTIRT